MAENTTENAYYIYYFFRDKGWTAQSICGMLGNMQVESDGIIADRDQYNGGGGYGLVQWDPKSKLVNWANANGLDYRTVDTQCKRIQYELENGLQYAPRSGYPMTFRQYTQSTSTPTYLAKIFLINYEAPANRNQPQRGDFAEYWYRILSADELSEAQYQELNNRLSHCEERQEPRYQSISSIPSWAYESIMDAIRKGIIRGSSSSNLDLSYTDLKALVADYRRANL